MISGHFNIEKIAHLTVFKPLAWLYVACARFREEFRIFAVSTALHNTIIYTLWRLYAPTATPGKAVLSSIFGLDISNLKHSDRTDPNNFGHWRRNFRLEKRFVHCRKWSRIHFNKVCLLYYHSRPINCIQSSPVAAVRALKLQANKDL
jgi:hypothetical protein